MVTPPHATTSYKQTHKNPSHTGNEPHDYISSFFTRIPYIHCQKGLLYTLECPPPISNLHRSKMYIKTR